MITLPRETRLTFREIDKPLRQVVTRVQPRWQGDRISVKIQSFIDERDNLDTPYYVFARRMLCTKIALMGRHMSPVDMSNTVDKLYGTFEAGTALFTFDAQNIDWKRNADVVIHVDRFSFNDDEHDQLLIARDAFLSNDDASGVKIAREVAPNSWALWRALCKRELKMMNVGATR